MTNMTNTASTTNTPSSPIRAPRRRRRPARRSLTLAAVVALALSAGMPEAMAAPDTMATPDTTAARPCDDHDRLQLQLQLRQRLQHDADAITAVGATGVQARVATSDGPTLTVTSGVADLTGRQPVSPDGYFRIASITKTFVATVTLQLVGENRLSLDDPIERWLPGVVSGNGNDGRVITVRQLLQHTSGIHDDYPDYTSAEDFQKHRNDSYTPEQIVARAMSHSPDFQPDTGWNYSNTGYVLLGMAIEKVTGRPWYEEVGERIVRPLGLDHTFRPGTSPTLPQPHAETYQRFRAGEPLVDVTEQVGPGTNGEAGLVSTTADLNRFFGALLGGRLLAPAQLAQMKQTVAVSPAFERLMPCARAGLGLFSRRLPGGGEYWGHEGGDAGWISSVGVTADGRRSVALSLSGVQADSEKDVVRVAGAESRLVEDALRAPAKADPPGR
ncbi:serine hydrolase domain-containing protein [Kitasatospora sp. NPDC048286]|uniref:serine hydrolase domain-containing protein n=1 Tax=Kitasatospora sp. NPDC048286 TaxID=3364047 RepID=UPI00371676D4